MWELLKSLFSEVNFSFWNASLFKLLSTVLPIWTESKVGPWSSDVQSLLPSRSVKAEEWIPSRAGAAQASPLPIYTSEKPHSWRVISVWSMYFFFNVLRGWGTLQLVVMRPTGCRERDGGELRALHMLLVIALTFQQTHKHTNHAKVFGTEFYSCHGMIHQECLHCFVSAVEVTLWGGEVKSLVLLQVHYCCCLCFFFKEITRSKIVV